MRKILLLATSLATIVILTNAKAETISSRIGDLQFTHDFANGYPSDETRTKLFDEMDFQRATQAYIWAIPLVSFAQ